MSSPREKAKSLLYTYGIILLTAFVLWYLASTENYGVPVFAPFAPMIKHDLRDSLVKYNLSSLVRRPAAFKSLNKRRMKHG